MSRFDRQRRAPSTPWRAPPPACAKNHIAIGSIDADTDGSSWFSSWGPADDGRIKPDLAAPGCQAGGDGGVTSCLPDGGYGVACGTSMASPTATGVAALILEAWRDAYGGHPGNAGMKAILASSARDLGPIGPDFTYGFGAIDAVAAVELVQTGGVAHMAVVDGDVLERTISIDPGTDRLVLTLAWDDAPGVPLAANALINDVDLALYAPDGAVWLPLVPDPDAPQAGAEPGVDTTNNIEQVVVTDPEPGLWTAVISGAVVAAGPQEVAAACTSPIATCSSAGRVSAALPLSTCIDPILIGVTDCDLNIDPDTDDTATVSISGPGGQTNLQLVEIAPHAGVFRGEWQPGAAFDVSDGDAITVTYFDADDGSGGSAVNECLIDLDCVPIADASVEIAQVFPDRIVFEVTSSEPSAARVHTGTACDALGTTTTSPITGTTHTIEVGGFTPDTAVVWTAEVLDAAGNITPAGEPCQTEQTAPLVECMTMWYDGSDPIDLIGRRITFTPAGTPDRYAVCTEPTSAYPVDPSGHPSLWIEPGSWYEYTLQQPIHLFGVAYDTLYVTDDGHIDLTEPFAAPGASAGAHFQFPRISVLWGDYLCDLPGSHVRCKTLEDRVVITYDGVIIAGVGGTSTAQCELFDDGRIAITVLQTDLQVTVVGLSGGEGMPWHGLAMDLAEAQNCGPQVPFALSQDANCPYNGSVELTLGALDPDGAGDPLAVITSVPVKALFDLEAGHQITADLLPYTLAGDGVRYQSGANAVGADPFTFMVVNEHGHSNEATVDVTIETPAQTNFFGFQNDPGLTMDEGWQWGVPTAGGSGGGVCCPDPNDGYGSDHVVGFEIGGNYWPSMDARYLRLPTLDLRGVEDVALEYMRWLNVDAPADGAAIEVRVGSSDWQPIWEAEGRISESQWKHMSHDLSALVDNQSGASIRFRMGPTNNVLHMSGWSLGYIWVRGSAMPEWTADVTGDGHINVDDVIQVVSDWGPCGSPCPSDISGDGLVGVDDLLTVVNQFE